MYKHIENFTIPNYELIWHWSHSGELDHCAMGSVILFQSPSAAVIQLREHDMRAYHRALSTIHVCYCMDINIPC